MTKKEIDYAMRVAKMCEKRKRLTAEDKKQQTVNDASNLLKEKD